LERAQRKRQDALWTAFREAQTRKAELDVAERELQMAEKARADTEEYQKLMRYKDYFEAGERPWERYRSDLAVPQLGEYPSPSEFTTQVTPEDLRQRMLKRAISGEEKAVEDYVGEAQTPEERKERMEFWI